MGMKTITTKVDEDGELYESFDEFRAKHDTTSEATRRALRAGLAEIQDESDTDSRRQTKASAEIAKSLWYAIPFLLISAIATGAAGTVASVPALVSLSELLVNSAVVVFVILAGVSFRVAKRRKETEGIGYGAQLLRSMGLSRTTGDGEGVSA